MNKEEADLIIAEQNKSKEEILKAVAKVKSDYHELCKLKDMRIAELEKENTELKETCNKWFEHLKNREEELLNELNNQNAKYNEQIEQLEKENAELKGIKDVATLIRANNDTVVTLMQLNNILVSKDKQLTKAKEIIKILLKYDRGQFFDDRRIYEKYMRTRGEAEQFISEVEK